MGSNTESCKEKKATKSATVAQVTEEATVKEDEDQAMSSQGQDAEEIETVEGSVDPGAASTQLKCPCIVEREGPRKKVKASKLAIDPITLTEGDLHDIGEMARDVTNEALQDFMQEHQTVLGALRVQLQELQVRPPQVGTLCTHLASVSSAVE